MLRASLTHTAAVSTSRPLVATTTATSTLAHTQVPYAAAIATPMAATTPLSFAQAYATDASRVKYDNPLVGRYSSPEMNYNWSPMKKFTTWRRLWLALAQGEQELGLNITDEQLDEMRAHLDDVNFEVAEAKEREVRHDVMSHVHAFGEQCPAAAPIIHLGATSCYVGDNTDLIQMRDGLNLLRGSLLSVMSVMKEQAILHRGLPTLGFTHYQPAQLTTVGKRMTLWLQDFLFDYHALVDLVESMPFRGVKGTTGTQASFLELFEGDHEKCRALDRRVAELMGFNKTIGVSGQTYTRKLDFQVLSVLSGIAQSAHKMAVDVRLLANLKEVEEPFEKKQIGSSAMAYKRNPMRCERITALARHVITNTQNAAHTHANQWFERTLDDSANRRLSLPEAFLGVDVILKTTLNVVDGIHVWPRVIEKHVAAELPFMATENILMAAVKKGGNRQDLHEVIRELSMLAGAAVKGEGKDNDLIERIAAHEAFASIRDSLDDVMDPANFVGRAPEQVLEFISEEVDPILERDAALLSDTDAAGAVSV